MTSYQSSSIANASQSPTDDLRRRVSAIQSRCRRLCEEGWDVNELSLIYEDIQALSSLASMADCDALADRLFNLEVYLSSFTESALIPKQGQLGEIARLLHDLDHGMTGMEADQEDADSAPEPAPAAVIASSDGDDAEDGLEDRGCILLLTGERDFKLMPLLQASDYLIRRCSDGQDLLAAVANVAPAAVIIDASLTEDLREIGSQAKKSNPNCALLVLSANADLGARLAAMRAGANAYLPENCSASELLERIEEAARPAEEDPYRVLIVEDDASQAIFAASILEKSGMQARKVLDPMEVLKALEDFEPDCILMDLYMPECEGTELTAIIRQQRRFVNTPILFLSGEQDKDKHYAALSAGGDDFLAKPIRPRHLISAVRNRVERARSLQHADVHSDQHDAITGLLDRSSLIELLDHRLESGELEKAGVLVVKLDNPRRMRELLGLAGMDELMAALAKRVNGLLGSNDRPARFGDYGVCVLVDGRHMEALIELGTDIRDAVNQHLFELDSRSTTAEVSVGVCPLMSAPGNAREILFAAESAADAIADDEGGGVGLFRPPEDDQTSSRDEALAETIKEALAADAFQLLFQPIVGLKGGEGQQYQTLLRLRQDDQVLPAAEFIPVAERCGLIVELDRLATYRAISVLSGHHRAGREVRLFISQSAASLEDPERTTLLRNAIDGAGIDPSMLTFEFKLQDILSGLPACRRYLDGLTDIGVSICISDFDDNSAASDVLRRISASYVKLARKFVYGSEQYKLREVLQRMVTTLHENDCQVIVPQVEDAGSIARLWSSGVDFIQGNFVQRPDEELSFDFSGSVF